MPKFPKNHKDVEYFVSCRKKRIAGSTKSTFDFLVYVHEDNPTLTIVQLRALITDHSKYIFQPEAVEVFDAYIEAGYGDFVPTWR